jgi:glycosyltransferase involved in cell wall biosynthesis
MMKPYAGRIAEERKVRLVNSITYGSVLDVGCGNGVYLSHWKEHARLVVGLDVDKSLAKIAHKRGFDVVAATVSSLPFSDKCFDCIWMSEVVEHLPSFDFVKEIERVASKKVILTLPNPISPHFKRDLGHILHYSISSLRERFRTESRSSPWRYVLRGLGFNEVIPGRSLRLLSMFLTWFLPWLSPTISIMGSNPKSEDKRHRFTMDVFAFSILESETMAGGYRIAIELIRSWSSYNGFTFYVHTTREGQEMFVKYLGRKDNIFYEVVCFPNILTKLCLDHALISIVTNISLSFQGLAKSFWDSKNRSCTFVYSVTPFLSDLLPSVILKLRFNNAKLFVSHAMFSPGLFEGVFNQISEKVPSLRDIGFFINEKLAYPLIKRYANVVSETNEIDRMRCIGDGFPPSSVITIPGGVDFDLSNSVPEEKNKQFDSVFVGRLHPQKGVLELVDIWRLVSLEKENAKLAIIGNGPLEQDVKRKILECRLGENCELFGFKDGIEKIKILKRSKTVVHPAMYDSGGMAPCEAMICGLPGVSFDLPALRVYYPKGMLKTPCFDLEAFAGNILKLLNNPILYDCTRKDAIDWARKWNWNETASKVLETIQMRYEEKGAQGI